MDSTAYTANIPSRFHEFAAAINQDCPVELRAVVVVGSVLTPDFNPEQSDINSIVVVDAVTTPLLDFMVGLGKQYSGTTLAAPMLMTPHYIATSLDVFPIEFFNYQHIHHPVIGSDPFQGLAIDSRDLRLQCEREMKSKLLWLHQGYIKSLGNEDLLVRQLIRSITDYVPLFRAILFLAGHELTLSAHDTARAVEEIIGLDGNNIFTTMLERKKTGRSSTEGLRAIFDDYYQATLQLSDYVEALSA